MAVAEKKVLSFLNQRNRPYTLQVVADNLAHQKLTKKMVEQALKSLADDGKITRKEIGKAKVFFPLQTDDNLMSNEEKEEKQAQLLALQEEVKAETEALKQLKAALKSAEETMTTEQLKERVSELTSQVEADERKLADLRSGGMLIRAEDRAAADQAFKTAMAAWSLRRRVFNAVWDAVSENMESNPQQMFEEVGIDTDKMVGIDFKVLEQLLSKKRKF